LVAVAVGRVFLCSSSALLYRKMIEAERDKTVRSSFAVALRSNNAIEKTLKRPNCLNFKSKNKQMKRKEAIEFLKLLKFLLNKLLGVADMSRNSIDVTCRTIENVLELYQLLKPRKEILFVKLYKQEFVRVLWGWVPIPMPNAMIKQKLESDFGQVTKVIERKCKDGLISGSRIVTMATMAKRDLQANLILSLFILMEIKFM